MWEPMAQVKEVSKDDDIVEPGYSQTMMETAEEANDQNMKQFSEENANTKEKETDIKPVRGCKVRKLSPQKHVPSPESPFSPAGKRGSTSSMGSVDSTYSSLIGLSRPVTFLPDQRSAANGSVVNGDDSERVRGGSHGTKASRSGVAMGETHGIPHQGGRLPLRFTEQHLEPLPPEVSGLAPPEGGPVSQDTARNSCEQSACMQKVLEDNLADMSSEGNPQAETMIQLLQLEKMIKQQIQESVEAKQTEVLFLEQMKDKQQRAVRETKRQCEAEKQRAIEETKRQCEAEKQRAIEETKRQCEAENQRAIEETKRQCEAENQRAIEETKRQCEAENQRAIEETKRQCEAENQRAIEETKCQCEAENQRAIEETKCQCEAEKQRAIEETKRQCEAEKQRAIEETKRQCEAEKQRAIEETKRQRGAEKQRAIEETKHQCEAEKQRAIEETKHQCEAEKQRAIEETKRQCEAEKQREIEETKRQCEAEKQRAIEETKRQCEAEKQRAIEETKRQCEAVNQRAIEETKRQCEAEKQRATEETKRQCEAEKQRAIKETKKKMWCSFCGGEVQLPYCPYNSCYNCIYQRSHCPQLMGIQWPVMAQETAENRRPQGAGPYAAFVHHNSQREGYQGSAQMMIPMYMGPAGTAIPTTIFPHSVSIRSATRNGPTNTAATMSSPSSRPFPAVPTSAPGSTAHFPPLGIIPQPLSATSTTSGEANQTNPPIEEHYLVDF